MIPANPWPPGATLVHAILRRRLRRGLSALRVDGAQRLAVREPLLLCANHVAFHDGLIAAYLSRGIPEPRVLMRADQLRRAPLLRWAGAFGVDESAEDGARAVRFALQFLDRPGRALWLFPQGSQRPQWVRPLGFKRGAILIARRSGALTLPVSIHYEFGERERPEAWVRIGPAVAPEALEAAVEEGLASLRARIVAEDELPSCWPVSKRLGEGIFSRVLARGMRQ